MRTRGILKPDSKFYISAAHDQRDLAQTTAAITEVADAMAAA
jgi:glutamate-1-semialdehyde aminotransferase